MKTELYTKQENPSKDVKFSIIDIIEILMFLFLLIFLLMTIPIRFEYGKEIIKTGVVEEVTFEYEIHDQPRGRVHFEIAKIKFQNDTMIYKSYHPHKIIDYGIELFKGQKVIFAARGNTIFGIVVNKTKLYYISGTKETTRWIIALILFLFDIILIRNNKKINLFKWI